MSFEILTDTSSNLPQSLMKKLNIHCVNFTYTIDNEHAASNGGEDFDGASFYGKMRNGSIVNTAQVNISDYLEIMEEIASNGKDLLYVGMSSGISGSYSTSCIAANEIKEKYPNVKIITIDTKAASLGEGIPVLKAVEFRDSGLSIEETAEKISKISWHMCQVFTVDDLKYLKRTGRLSNFKATVATILGIKPILKGNEEGKIITFMKTRSRNKSIEALAMQYKELVVNAKDQIIGIAEADCKDDANMLCNMLNEISKPKEIMVVPYEPVTGSHVGPGTLALFFISDERSRR